MTAHYFCLHRRRQASKQPLKDSLLNNFWQEATDNDVDGTGQQSLLDNIEEFKAQRPDITVHIGVATILPDTECTN